MFYYKKLFMDLEENNLKMYKEEGIFDEVDIAYCPGNKCPVKDDCIHHIASNTKSDRMNSPFNHKKGKCVGFISMNGIKLLLRMLNNDEDEKDSKKYN